MAFQVTLDKQGGTGGAKSFAFDPDSGKAYSDLTLATQITSVAAPRRPGYAFAGYFSSASAGTKYIDSDGSLLDIVYDRTWNKNISLYARWNLTCRVMTLDDGQGIGGPGHLYYRINGGGWFKDEDLTIPLSAGYALEMPRRSGYRSAGYYDYSSGSWGTRITSNRGTVLSALLNLAPTEDLTYTARWFKVYTVTLNDGDGDGGVGNIYFCNISGIKWCTDELCDNPIDGNALASVPELTYYKFNGYFSSSSGGTKYVTSTGSFLSEFPEIISHDETWYAQYSRLSYRIAIKDGSSIVKRIFTSHAGSVFYSDWRLTRIISSLSDVGLPSKECYSFYGCRQNADGSGVKYINSTGAFRSELTTLTFSGNLDIYVEWSRVSFKVSIAKQGGSGGTDALYVPGSCEHIYSDDQLTAEVSSISVPSRAGYALSGCWSATSGGTKYINSNGSINNALRALTVSSAGLTIYAQWNPQVYLLSFDANGWTTPTQSKVVTMGEPIGTLPNPVNPNGRFLGWKLNGEKLSETTLWTTPANATAIADWRYHFSNLTDWFGLETSDGPLMLVASTDGATRSVTETSHSGALAIQTADSSVGAFELGGILLNPTCTYRIRKNGTLQIQLGKAWAKTGTVKSGYMIVSAEYATASDGEPVLVVRGAANEGADAINRWNVNLSVNPDHIAQDPMGAVSGGGEMTECKTLITCDPVVPMENGMPCASDVVHGKVVVTATTNAYFGEIAPTAAGAFVEKNGTPNSEEDVDFTIYAFQAERSL